MDERLVIAPPERDGAYNSAPNGDGKGEADVRALDQVLVRRAQKGDRDAFESLYRQHHGAVFRMVRFALGSGGGDAEDSTSETFIRAWRGLPAYRDTGAPFVSWLFGIARHVVADERRRLGRVRPIAEIPEHAYEQEHDERLDLLDAVDLLPPEQRIVIEMKYFAGLSNAEVAALLGSTPGAVNAKQWRALQALLERLGKR